MDIDHLDAKGDWFLYIRVLIPHSSTKELDREREIES